MNGQQKRQRGRRRNQFAHQPGGFIAVEKLVGHLQMGEHLAPSASCRWRDIADIPRFFATADAAADPLARAAAFPSRDRERNLSPADAEWYESALRLGAENK
jgi:hypothetical protein